MKVLVVGYGSIGKRHARHARELGHDVAVFETSAEAEKAATSDGFTVLTTYPETEWAPIGAVIIATPADTHGPVFWRYVMSTSARIFIEKPLALSVENFWSDMERDTGWTNRVQVGYNLRYHEGICLLKEKLRDLGNFETALFRIHCDMRTWPGKDYADALLECSHEIDLACYLLGRAQLHSATVSDKARAWNLVLQHETGCWSTVSIDCAAPGYKRDCYIYGSRGRASWLWDAPTTTACSVWVEPSYHGGLGFLRALTVPAEQSYRAELAAFFAEDARDVCTVEDALHVLAICDAARSNAKTPR